MRIATGKRLVALRLRLGMGQVEFAKVLKISQQRLWNYECGLRSLSLPLAIRLCQRYGATLEWLYLGKGRVPVIVATVAGFLLQDFRYCCFSTG